MNSKYLWFQKIIMTPLYRIYDTINEEYDTEIMLSQDNCLYMYNLMIPENKERFIIERCAWIQDINWNRMYEWDIVTFWLYYKDIKYTLVYEWMQWKISDWANLKFVTDWKDLEVVWNIHS